MFQDILDWLTYWTAAWGISSVEWIQRTAQYAGDWFFNSFYVLGQWYAALRFYALEYIRYAVEFKGTLIIKLHELLMVEWERVKHLWTDWWIMLFNLTTTWGQKVYYFFNNWWEWVEAWFDGWVQFLVPLLEEHKEKILYSLTDGWPKVWWFINDRWLTLFGTIEGHIEGWQLFVDDPAQALWDWVEPKLQTLGADWLVKLW